jgi:hypothetical protein
LWLPSAVAEAIERKWATPSRKATFSVFESTYEDDIPRQDGVLNLVTIRSHD